MEKFWALDLSEIDSIMRDRYSNFGPEPMLPSDMLRSILLSAECKITSYTNWAADLKENHLHAILSGFTVGDTPGNGTFYDFQKRLWLSDDKNLSDPVHPPKQKPKKPDKKGVKPLPLKKPLLKTFLNSLNSNRHMIWNPAGSSMKFLKCFFLTVLRRTGSLTL